GPDERFERLVAELAGLADVTLPGRGRGFGRSAVRYRGKIALMLARGRLVLKLPAARVDELIAAGHGERFDSNKGTPMKEWLSLHSESDLAWLPLAGEALDFGRGE